MSEEIVIKEQFDAFISYSRHDSDFAKKLAKELEDFDPPEIDNKKLKKLNIFLDSEDLEGGGDYYKTIDNKLAKSNKLIVICSPKSRQSKFVNDEIKKFVIRHKAVNILPILIDGIPNNEATPKNEHLKAFPEALVEALEMPLAVSFEGIDWRKNSFTKDILRGAWYSILAKIYGISRDKIERRDILKRKHKRNQQVGLLGLAMIFIIGSLIWGWINALDNIKISNFKKSYTQAKIFEEKAGRAAQQQSVTGYQKAWLYTLAALKQEIDTTDVKNDLEESKARLQRKVLSNGAGIEQQLWMSPISPSKTRQLIVSPSGKYTATISENGKIYLWDNNRGEQIYSWLPGAINSLCFSPNDSLLLTWSDSVLTLWSIDHKLKVNKIKSHREKGIRFASINPRSVEAAFYIADTIKTWLFDLNWFTSIFLDTIKINNTKASDIKQLAFTPEGKIIYVDGQSGSIKIESENKSRGDVNTNIKIAVASKKDRIGYVDKNNVIIVWDFDKDTKDTVGTLEKAAIERLAFNRTADKLALGFPGKVEIYGIPQTNDRKPPIDTTLLVIPQTNDRKPPIDTTLTSFITQDRIIAATDEGRLAVWDTNGVKIASTLGHNSDVNTVAFQPNPGSSILATGANDGTIILWDYKEGREKKRIRPYNRVVLSLDFLSNGDSLVVGVKKRLIGKDKKGNKIYDSAFVYIWDIKNDNYPLKLEGLEDVWDVAVAHTKSQVSRAKKIAIALNHANNNLKIWDYKSGTVKTLVGHTSGVRKVAFNPNDSLLASVSDDKTICIWSADSAKKVLQWKGHNDKIYGVAWSPNGEYIATAATDETVRLWEVNEIEEKLGLNSSRNDSSIKGVPFSDKLEIRIENDIWYIPSPKDNQSVDTLWTVVFNEKNNALAYKRVNDSTINYIKLDKAKILKGHLDEVWDVDFSPDGELLVSGSGDFGVRLWHVDTGLELARLDGHNGDVFSVKFSPHKNSNLIASGSSDHSIRLWDLSSAYDSNYIKTFEDTVRAVTVSKDKKYLAYGGHDQHVYIDSIHSEESGIKRTNYDNWEEGYDVLCMDFNKQGGILAYGTTNNEIKFYGTKEKKRKIDPVKVDGDVLSLSFNNTGTSLASATSSGEISLWNVGNVNEKDTVSLDTILIKENSKARCVKFSPLDNYLVVGFSSSNKSIYLWEKMGHDWQHFKKVNLGHHSDGVWSVAFSPDEKYLASASWDNTIRIWDLVNKEKLLTLRGHQGPVTSLVFVDSTTLASGSLDHTIRLWDRATGNELDVINAHSGTVYSMAIDPTGRFLVSGSADKSLRFHEINPDSAQQNTHTIEQYAYYYNAFQFMLPFRLEGDELKDSETNYFLSPLSENDPFPERQYSKWMLKPRPQGNEVFDWMSTKESGK